MTPTHRILCIAPSWLGDAILSLPALAVLREAETHVEVFVRAGLARIYTDGLDTRNVYETSARSRLQRWRDARALRARHFHGALILPPSFSSALMAWFAGAPERLGERRDGRRLLLTESLPRASREVHLARTYANLVAALLRRLSLATPNLESRLAALPPPRLRARPFESQSAHELLRRHGITGRRFLAVAPGARFGPAKRYPAERFAQAAARLSRELQLAVVLLGGAGDRADTAAVRQHLPRAVDLAGRTSMEVLLGLLAAAAGVLSNDSGIMHLAAALSTPVVGVFGSTHPGWTAPLGARVRVVQHPVPCAPCFRKSCPIDFPCMLQLEPERLVEAMQELLGREQAGRPEKAAPL